MCAEADIDDVCPAYYVDRLIGMLRDVVPARAIVLDKNVVDRMFEYLRMPIYITISQGRTNMPKLVLTS